jgi:glutamate dehydrogenase/leucine dehydrogenase
LPDGLDIDELMEHVRKKCSVASYLNVENMIHRRNADKIKASVIVEAANAGSVVVSCFEWV